MSTGGAFSGSRGAMLVIVGGTAFLAILLSQIFGDRLGLSRSFGADPSSISAIGTRAFMRTLDRLGIRVELSAPGAFEPGGDGAVLVITDPRRAFATKERRNETLGGVERAIVVLPKWTGEAATPDNRWIGPVRRSHAAASVWRLLSGTGSVREVDELGPATITIDGLDPSLPAPQLVTSDRLLPLVSFKDGTLIGELLFQEGDIETVMMILADPDLIANHNIAEAGNAALAVRMVEDIRPPGARLVFEAPGASAANSFWQRAFAFPYALFTLHAVLALIMVLWAGTGRFGGPVRPAPALKAGREQLIANAADLLDHARHGSTVLGSYARAVLDEVARAMKAPRNLGHTGLLAFLDDVAARRGRPADAASLFARAAGHGPDRHLTTGGLVRTAMALYRWKREMTDDTGRSSRS